MLNNLEDVIMFASLYHEGQKMFEPEVSYLTHVMGVASNVLEAYHNGEEKFDLDYALKVAILHDTLEDTKATYDDIASKFGEEVARGVKALTKNENIEKVDRMKDSIERIKECPKEVAIVKLADRVYNLRCVPKSWSNEKVESYKQEGKVIYEELHLANKYLAEKLNYRINKYGLGRCKL